MKGLYIHIPFCVRKCSYCDFYSLAGRSKLISSYIHAVLEESALYSGQGFQTIYLGGGTPSLLDSEILEKLMNGLWNILGLSGLVEATIEVNPDSATPELLQKAKELGFNRVSIGVQSLDDKELQSVGRVHTSMQAVTAIKQGQAAGFSSISTDLIAGLPGQTWESLYSSLRTLVTLGINHLSLYCLAVEEGTPLSTNIPANLPSDDMQAELFEKARQYLREQGFIHYEISNFAREGHQCQHNLNYWRGGEYVGLGPAAASHLEGKRYKNKADLEAYLTDPTSQTEYTEKLNITSKAAEEAMLRLRLIEEGLNINELAARYGKPNIIGITTRLEILVREGHLQKENYCYKLKPERILTANPIFAEVLSPI
jgi:oxygen-independent coproporphyrinogen III oxidase